MGAIISRHTKPTENKPSTTNHSNAPDESIPFVNEEYVEILTNSWLDIQDVGAELIGEIAFKQLFLALPETFSMFHSFAEDPSWESSPKFKHHCKVVVNVIGSCIKILRKPSLIISHLNYLGFQHNFRKIIPSHFTLFGKEFITALSVTLGRVPGKWTDKTKEAWQALYDKIAKIMLDNMTGDDDDHVFIPKTMLPALPVTHINVPTLNPFSQPDNETSVLTMNRSLKTADLRTPSVTATAATAALVEE